MKLIPLKGKYGEGKCAKIDDEDFDKIKAYSWYVNEGYVITYHKGRRMRMHRIIMDAPAGMQVDHIKRDKLDHRKSELRLCTQQQNNANVEPRAISGFKGVFKDPSCKSWRAAISVNGKMEALGSYENPHFAALVFDLWAIDLHGEFAHTNFSVVGSPEFTKE